MLTANDNAETLAALTEELAALVSERDHLAANCRDEQMRRAMVSEADWAIYELQTRMAELA